MFFSEHRLKMTSLRIGKHRIVKKSEHRPPLPMVALPAIPSKTLELLSYNKALYVLTSSAPFFRHAQPFFTCVKT